MPEGKTKAYIYIMGKIEDNNSLVRAIQIDVTSTNTVQDVIDFLYDSSKIKTKDVWLSIKQNGTRLNEFVTLKDIEVMIQQSNEVDIHLYVYNTVVLFNQTSTQIKSSRPCPSVLQKIEFNEPNPQQIELIKLEHSMIQTNKHKASLSFNTQHLSTNQNLVETRPRGLSKKESIKQRRKDQCCLLM